MTVYVYAHRKTDAAAWARGQGIRPRDCVLFGARSRGRGQGVRFKATDQIVVLGKIPYIFEQAIIRGRARIGDPPDVQRY